MKSVIFIMGSGPGMKPPGPKINDTIFKESTVNLVVVQDVSNNSTFTQDKPNGDLFAGNEAGFPAGVTVTVFYTPCLISCS